MIERQAEKLSLNQQRGNKGTNLLEHPIFLCGYPKSGTTLLLALLDNHPELVVFPEETWFFRQVYDKPEAQNIEYVLTKTGSDSFRYGEVEWSSGYRDYRNIDFETYENLVYKFWHQSPQTVFDILESQIMAYQEVTNQHNKRFWVEKTPKNEHFLPIAFNQYPKLKAIYILRDPRDNFASYRLQRQKKKQLLTLNSFIHSWVDSLYHWTQFANDHQEQTLIILYHELVDTPKETMQRIADFLTISYDDCLLQPTRNGVFWSGNSVHGQQHQAISTTSLGKYKKTLSPAEIACLEVWLGKLMHRFSWQLENPPAEMVSQLQEFFNPMIGSLKEKALLYRRVRALEKKLL